MKNKITVCYFGIYDPLLSRNKIYINALKKVDVEIIECNDRSPGFMKYIKLFIKHWKIKNTYDILIVGYGGWVMVPLAKLVSRKPVVFDALCSLYEANVISRGFSKFSFKYYYTKLVDFLAFKLADVILLETNQQKNFIVKRFKLKPKKCFRLFTGVDEESFYIDPSIKKRVKFTVLFRGKFLPEAGVRYIIEAAKLLEKEDVNFLIIGFGFLEKEIENLIKKLNPSNVELIKEHLPIDKLRNLMLSCHVSLGQFENNERLERTIPNKAFESLAMKLPYITGRANGIAELLEDKKDCLMVNLADSIDLADKIRQLKNDPALRKYLSESGFSLYQAKFPFSVLGNELLQILERTI